MSYAQRPVAMGALRAKPFTDGDGAESTGPRTGGIHWTAGLSTSHNASMERHIERFELPITIAPDDIDDLGHVNNVVYLRWVQEVAIAHWSAAATAAQQAEVAWVAVRHEIDYKRAALLGDAIVARTWVGTADSHRFERLTEIVRVADQRVLASARTVWCPINRATGKLTRVSPEIRARFSVAGDHEPMT
jgi:acyl-CoA thioester hydrolase